MSGHAEVFHPCEHQAHQQFSDVSYPKNPILINSKLLALSSHIGRCHVRGSCFSNHVQQGMYASWKPPFSCIFKTISKLQEKVCVIYTLPTRSGLRQELILWGHNFKGPTPNSNKYSHHSIGREMDWIAPLAARRSY